MSAALEQAGIAAPYAFITTPMSWLREWRPRAGNWTG